VNLVNPSVDVRTFIEPSHGSPFVAAPTLNLGYEAF